MAGCRSKRNYWNAVLRVHYYFIGVFRVTTPLPMLSNSLLLPSWKYVPLILLCWCSYYNILLFYVPDTHLALQKDLSSFHCWMAWWCGPIVVQALCHDGKEWLFHDWVGKSIYTTYFSPSSEMLPWTFRGTGEEKKHSSSRGEQTKVHYITQ